MLIFRAVGDNPVQFIAELDRIGMLNEFVNIKCPKVFWSQDSHHMHPQESQVQNFFSRYYIAHHAYLDKFIPAKTVWLPCCLTSLPIPYLVSIANSRFTIDRNIIFPYRLYSYAPRNIIVHKIKTILEQKSISHFFGALEGNGLDDIPWGNMYAGLTSSKIILNTSLTDDLNIRNFEAIAINEYSPG